MSAQLMIKNLAQYERTQRKIEKLKGYVKRLQKDLISKGLPEKEILFAIQPQEFFIAQMQDELDEYDHIKQGQIREIYSIEYIGRLLIALRCAKNMSQRELAERLGVDESVVSKDENNEYYGITAKKIGRIIDALGVRIKISVDSLDTETQSEVPKYQYA